jgi:serine/threonine-protein kinase PknG
LSTLPYHDLHRTMSILAQPMIDTPEVGLALARTALSLGAFDVLAQAVNELLARDPWNWRAVWLQGLGELKRGQWLQAMASFNAVYGQMPGELAPKLALAVACEQSGRDIDLPVAEKFYSICATTDSQYVTACAFGLARLRAKTAEATGAHDVTQAIAALDMIPPTSSGYDESRRLAAAYLITVAGTIPALQQAWQISHDAKLDARSLAQIDVAIYEGVRRGLAQPGAPHSIVIGDTTVSLKAVRRHGANSQSISHMLEQALRQQASLEHDPDTRTALSQRANSARGWTFL